MLKRKQTIFDKVVRHLGKQRKQSKHGKSCRYRGPNGTMCAVGCLIKDKYYTEDLEGCVVGSSVVRDALVSSGVQMTIELEQMLRDLQHAHDRCYVGRWGKHLLSIAETYELNTKTVLKYF